MHIFPLNSDYLDAVTFTACRYLDEVYVLAELELAEDVNAVGDFFGLVFLVLAVYEKADVVAVGDALDVDEFIECFVVFKLADLDEALYRELGFVVPENVVELLAVAVNKSALGVYLLAVGEKMISPLLYPLIRSSFGVAEFGSGET